MRTWLITDICSVVGISIESSSRTDECAAQLPIQRDTTGESYAIDQVWFIGSGFKRYSRVSAGEL
jgi:hypothetical protein